MVISSKGAVAKVNWDTTVNVKDIRVGIRVIIRDSNDDIMACLCSNERILSTPTITRVLALERAMTRVDLIKLEA